MIRIEIRRAGIVGALCTVLCLAAVSAQADSHQVATESKVTGEEGATPPPGTLGREGVVPKEGGAGESAGMLREPIGHVPGPDEGVYGDPPNTGGTMNPETRGWAYDTGYLFAMTRSLETDTDLGTVGRRWVQPWTLTFDVVTLPTAALAGLSGRAPAEDEPDESVTSTSGAEPDDSATSTSGAEAPAAEETGEASDDAMDAAPAAGEGDAPTSSGEEAAPAV